MTYNSDNNQAGKTEFHMKIYLAARYSRRLELCEYRSLLEAEGHQVTSRWLNGQHQISDSGAPIGERAELLVEGDDGGTSAEAIAMRERFAIEDFKDVQSCDLLIAFTEPPRSRHSRGGRHVELGLAMGMMKRVWVIGYRENIFCWLEDVRFFKEFNEAKKLLGKEKTA